MKRATRSRIDGCRLLVVAGALLVPPAAPAANVPASSSPPGTLVPAVTPQMVLLTFDDSVTTTSYDLVQQVLTNHANPNGHAIRATFFVSMDSRYDFARVQRLYADGHEIGVHTMSHATHTNTDLVRWHKDIAGCRKALSMYARIPEEAIVGFRAPYLLPNDATFQVLHARGFLYDSSFSEFIGGTSTSPAAMLWPYTMDGGVPQSVPAERKPLQPYPGLFEIPLWGQFTNGATAASMDPPESFDADAVLALWKTNFLARYNGNRAPYFVALHATATNQWLSNPTHSAWRVAALNEFIDWALGHTDTWFVTCRSLAEFMQAPVDTSAAPTSTPFLTFTSAYHPSSDVRRCTYPNTHSFHVCGTPVPPAAPAFSNLWMGLVEDPAGSVSVSLASQDVTYAYGTLSVSNDSPRTLHDWEAEFSVAGGLLNQMFDATWSTNGTQVVAHARQYNTHLAPGQVRQIAFRVLRTGGDVSFPVAGVQTWGLGALPVSVRWAAATDPHRAVLAWDDLAHEYAVECSTGRFDGAWAEIRAGLFRTACTTEVSAVPGPLFFRVRGIHY